MSAAAGPPKPAPRTPAAAATPGPATDDPGARTPGTNDAQTLQEATVNVTALLGEAAKKSDIMWIEVPEDRTFAVWFAWAQDRFYVVSGEGEQLLPPLPEMVRIILRSKDSGGRLITVNATAHLLSPQTPSWESAVQALSGERLNATDDQGARWAESGRIHALHPVGAPVAAPGTHARESGRASVIPAGATTLGWRPWHAGRS
ncbi:MAG: hypothetical protein Q4G67_04590 [Actinomycetia bacterium]|nr:hypothetical protein [Actinomycetes bacterium]